MQASLKAKVAEGGISTFGLELQFLTDELSAMTEERARVRSALLRGLLSRSVQMTERGEKNGGGSFWAPSWKKSVSCVW